MTDPIMRMHHPLNDTATPGPLKTSELFDFNDRTGAMNTTIGELVGLNMQLGRDTIHPTGSDSA